MVLVYLQKFRRSITLSSQAVAAVEVTQAAGQVVQVASVPLLLLVLVHHLQSQSAQVVQVGLLTATLEHLEIIQFSLL
jgi:hypothetical protein